MILSPLYFRFLALNRGLYVYKEQDDRHINENACSILNKIIVPMKKLFFSHFCSHLEVDYPLKRVFTLTVCVIYLNADCDFTQFGL